MRFVKEDMLQALQLARVLIQEISHGQVSADQNELMTRLVHLVVMPADTVQSLFVARESR